MSDHNKEPELLTTQEAAEFLRISPASMHKLKRNGELPFVELGKRVFFTREILINYINDHTKVNSNE